MSISLDHSPIHPVRKSVIGEGIFLSVWQNQMASHQEGGCQCDNSCALDHILQQLPDRVTQRHATVAASFITWLGTNGGRAFLDQAERYKKALPSTLSAYSCAWAEVNRRSVGVSFGIRTIEAFLGPLELVTEVHDVWKARKLLPELTVADYETVEAVVEWLSTQAGSKFLTTCAQQVRERASERLAEERMAYGGQSCG